MTGTGGCADDSETRDVFVTFSPQVVLNGLHSGSPICEGEAVQLSITFTGTGPFTFTLEDDQGNSWVDIEINDATSGVPYIFTVPDNPSWLGPMPYTGPTSYVYSITALGDATGCPASSIGGSASVDVEPRPTTGTIYHVPNNYGY